MKVLPDDPFMLMANSVQEIKLKATTKSTGNMKMFVNVVGILSNLLFNTKHR